MFWNSDKLNPLKRIQLLSASIRLSHFRLSSPPTEAEEQLSAGPTPAFHQERYADARKMIVNQSVAVRLCGEAEKEGDLQPQVNPAPQPNPDWWRRRLMTLQGLMNDEVDESGERENR